MVPVGVNPIADAAWALVVSAVCASSSACVATSAATWAAVIAARFDPQRVGRDLQRGAVDVDGERPVGGQVAAAGQTRARGQSTGGGDAAGHRGFQVRTRDLLGGAGAGDGVFVAVLDVGDRRQPADFRVGHQVPLFSSGQTPQAATDVDIGGP